MCRLGKRGGWTKAKGKGAQIFQKSRRHPIIQGTRRVTRSKSHADDPQILGANVGYKIKSPGRPGTWDLCTPGFEYVVGTCGTGRGFSPTYSVFHVCITPPITHTHITFIYHRSYTGYFIRPSGNSDLCGTVAGMVRPKGSMSTERDSKFLS
jgi:hypothetical protein